MNQNRVSPYSVFGRTLMGVSDARGTKIRKHFVFVEIPTHSHLLAFRFGLGHEDHPDPDARVTPKFHFFGPQGIQTPDLFLNRVLNHREADFGIAIDQETGIIYKAMFEEATGEETGYVYGNRTTLWLEDWQMGEDSDYRLPERPFGMSRIEFLGALATEQRPFDVSFDPDALMSVIDQETGFSSLLDRMRIVLQLGRDKKLLVGREGDAWETSAC